MVTSIYPIEGIALGTGGPMAAGSLGALVSAIAGGAPAVAQKTLTFAATPVSVVPLFTVTGAVLFSLTAICLTELTPAVGGATVSVGTAAAVAGLIAVTTAADIDTGEIWFAAAPATKLNTAAIGQLSWIIGDGADIQLDVAVQAITSGVIAFTAFWQPLSAGATLAAV